MPGPSEVLSSLQPLFRDILDIPDLVLTEDMAAKYSVSRAWVHRLQQRRRETGSIAPRKQTRWRTPILTPDQQRARGRLSQSRPVRVNEL